MGNVGVTDTKSGEQISEYGNARLKREVDIIDKSALIHAQFMDNQHPT